jgi:hypothetical protein
MRLSEGEATPPSSTAAEDLEGSVAGKVTVAAEQPVTRLVAGLTKPKPADWLACRLELLCPGLVDLASSQMTTTRSNISCTSETCKWKAMAIGL